MAGVKAFFTSLMDRGKPAEEDSDVEMFKAACERSELGCVSAALPSFVCHAGKEFQEHLSRASACVHEARPIDTCMLALQTNK